LIFQQTDGTWVNEIHNQHYIRGADGTYYGTMECTDNLCPKVNDVYPAPKAVETMALNVAPFGCLPVQHKVFDVPATEKDGPDHYEIWSVPRLTNAGANQTMSTVHLRQEDREYDKNTGKLVSYYRGELNRVVDADGTVHTIKADFDAKKCTASH